MNRIATVALIALTITGCGGERRFPFDAARRATLVRVSHVNSDTPKVVREINDPKALQRILRIIDRYDSWEAMPECRFGTCDDIRVDWILNDEILLTLKLCNEGNRARVGDAGPDSVCGRRVPESTVAALLKELGEQ